jgi:hypothetical protein
VLKSVFARRPAAALVACAAFAALALPASASAGSGGVGADSPPPPPVAGSKAKLLSSGVARAPADAPAEVQAAIAAANEIDDAGYCMGGGHKRVERCYDCSGTVSYVLGPRGADVLDSPLDSGSLRRWGERGRGSWITVYTNPGHAYVVIAGLRFDTSMPDDGAEGPGWSKDVKAGLVNGPFQKRHYLGL